MCMDEACYDVTLPVYTDGGGGCYQNITPCKPLYTFAVSGVPARHCHVNKRPNHNVKIVWHVKMGAAEVSASPLSDSVY